MFELQLAYIKAADRERDVTADLRRRQILRSPAEERRWPRAETSTASWRRAGTRARAVER